MDTLFILVKIIDFIVNNYSKYKTIKDILSTILTHTLEGYPLLLGYIG
ncbi:MAG: hypothetical protein QG670_2650 [Thermoproteota archaeon]|nr:hypothetical protein [Thermoproteota archaeon]